MSRYYVLSQWCDRCGISIHRDGDEYNAGFIFSYNGLDCHYDYYEVINRPDVVRDWLKDNFGLR